MSSVFFALAQKRWAYFASHYADLMRVNNVRRVWNVHHPDAALMQGFYDGSLWENR
jgi:hypothetical protein